MCAQVFCRLALYLVAGCFVLEFQAGAAQIFTVDSGASGPITNSFVTHGSTWHWRRGTNAPQVDWRTAGDGGLDATWVPAPGGFGYGDDAIVGEATRVNPGMLNVHTTVYIRHSFPTTTDLDTNANLVLTVDYDDGFVAYLDGTEIARRNVPGAAGSAVANTATTGGVSHEASCCSNPNPPVSTDLGPIAARLPPGNHVLAIIGVNQEIGSSDFHLIADLAGVASSGTNSQVTNLGLYVLSTSDVITLQGLNTMSGSARVTVNGDNAAFATSNGMWSATRTLAPGLNRLYIASLGNPGNILSNVILGVVYQASALFMGGTLSDNTAWTDPRVVVHVTNNLVITDGATLTIGPGVVTLLSPSGAIIATNDSALNIAGSEESPAVFLPADGTSWGSLMAGGTNSALTIRHAEIVSGQVRSLNGGVVLMEDSVSRELPFGTREIVAAVNGGSLTLRRSRLARFTEIDSRDTPVLVEGCLLEGFFIDGLDIKGTDVPLIVRETTLRFASPTNSNADALDFGPGPGTVERCLIHDFPDKGVSIGGASGTTIRDTLIYKCGIGISAYSSSNCVFVNNTISACLEGILFRDNPQPAFGAATNLIVWGNTNNVVITNTSALTIQFSDIQGTNFPGAGNISSDPLFLNAAGGDYRVGPGSPTLGSGQGGATMGVPFPVGGIPAQPLRLAALTPSTNHIFLTWIDDAENEDGILVQRSVNGLQWQTVGTAGVGATNYADFTVQLDQPYYYRIRATNGAGVSAFSNPTRATLVGPSAFAGGALTADTTWSGTIFVTNNVTVPAPFTLTISAGTRVRLTNSVGIAATGGGHVDVAGTFNQPVTFDRADNSFTRWGDLTATGSGSTLVVRHAKITRGRVRGNSNGVTTVEDSELSEMTTTGIIGGSGGGLFTIRRTYVHDYEDIDLGNTPTVAEDSLFERANSDIFELQNSPVGSVLRRCTFRNCLNPNSDGIDMNGCRNVLIDSCLVHDVTDKGISSGSATSASDPTSFGLVVTNTLVYNADRSIGIKDSGTAALFGNTFTAAREGVAVYAKFTSLGGHVTNGADNLIWGVTTAVLTTNSGTLSTSFSDLEGTNYPGVGNFSADPLWRDAVAHDYRLLAGSPGLGAGEEGRNVGIIYPVGGLPATPAGITPVYIPSTVSSPAAVGVSWPRFNGAGFIQGYVLERATAGGPFSPLNSAAQPLIDQPGFVATNFYDTNIVLDVTYSYRVRATNFIGDSFNTDAVAVTPVADRDHDGMADDWEIAHNLNPDLNDAADDPDHDGFTNLQEYQAGTDPQDAASRLYLAAVRSPGAPIVLTFSAAAGKAYTIQARPSLAGGMWTDWVTIPASSTNSVVNVTNNAASPQGYYRIRTP